MRPIYGLHNTHRHTHRQLCIYMSARGEYQANHPSRLILGMPFVCHSYAPLIYSYNTARTGTLGAPALRTHTTHDRLRVKKRRRSERLRAYTKASRWVESNPLLLHKYTVELRNSGPRWASPSFIKGVRSPRWQGEAEGARPCGDLARGLTLVVVRIHDSPKLLYASSQPRLEVCTAHLPPSVVGHVLKQQLHLVRSGLG